MSKAEQELLLRANASGAVSIYCMAALIAEEAVQNGCDGFAKSIEKAMEGLLDRLPRDQQRQALSLSHDMATAGDEPVLPRLRLVYSRD